MIILQSTEVATLQFETTRRSMLQKLFQNLRINTKTFLLKFPWIFEFVQSIPDQYEYRKSLAKGSFAQHGEDIEIMRLLDQAKATGFYVDIGCNHPYKLSNTYLLYLNGWRGLCVDPLPRFVNFYRKWRPEDRFECVGISENHGELPFYEFEADVYSTFDMNLANINRENGFKFRQEVLTKIKTVDSLLESNEYVAPISLLSIDIEGHELSALKSITLDKWKPAFICLEVLTPEQKRCEEPIAYLLANGYCIESDLGTNVIFRRNV
jgi:FkbM family methyltransferase